MITPPDDVVPLADLGPLGEDEELAEDQFSDLLHSFDGDSEDADSLDDSTATELDSGVSVEDGESWHSDAQETPLDVGDIVGIVEEAEGDGDELGPLDDGVRAPVDDDEEVEPSDDGEGRDSMDDLLTDMPTLDASADGDLEGAETDDTEALSGAEEEDPPRHAELQWLEIPLARTGQPRRVIGRAGDDIVAAGVDIIRVDPEDTVNLVAGELEHGVASLVVDADRRTVIVATDAGDLFRISTPETAVEALVSWRTGPRVARSPSIELSLGGPTPSSRPAILLHVSTGGGTLLESTDHGTTFRRVELGGRILSLSTGSPPCCLVETSDSFRLFRSTSSGGFTAVGGEWTFEVEHLGLVSDGDIVAVLERGHGVRVSVDQGATFRRVGGSGKATAVTAGRLGGRRSVFAALFDPASGRSAIVWIDAASADAYVVADLTPNVEEDEEDDWTRVSSLGWDPNTETLWAAGSFGLRRWRRPPSA